MSTATINQREIARRLKLSAATVSRSFRNHPDITQETKSRVLQEAERVGYTKRSAYAPASAGSGVVPMRTSVGIIVAGVAGPITRHQLSGMMTAGISMAASERNIVTVVHHVQANGGSELLDPGASSLIQNIGSLNGLVLLHGFDPEVVKVLSAKTPCVTIAHAVAGSNADHVDSDHVNAIADLLDHLKGLGHRRIGFIGRTPHSAITRSRFSSFVQSLDRLSLEWDRSMQFDYPVAGTDADQQQQIDFIVESVRSGVTAFQCDSDGTARRIVRELSKRELRVPEDVSITGYDGFSNESPLLTTVRVPFVELGSAALRRLAERMARPDDIPQQVLLRCSFEPGPTTAPPKQLAH
jgi:LacI family transcriptional regulator